MNYNEFIQLLKQCRALGIRTFGDLKRILDRNGISGNNNIINFVNELFVKENHDL